MDSVSLSLTPPAEILSGKLFLSDAQPAQNRSWLEKFGITHVVNVTGHKLGTGELRFPDKHADIVKYLHLAVPDEMEVDIIPVIEESCKFINDALSICGNKVLVHCEAGISRSPTVVIGYLMRNGLSLRDSYELVLRKKSNIAPNKSFWNQLISLEKQLFKRDTASLSTEEYLSRQIKSMCQSELSVDKIMDILKKNGNDVDLTVDELLTL
jgi:hypothetical protein